jgi:hypothetical protein
MNVDPVIVYFFADASRALEWRQIRWEALAPQIYLTICMIRSLVPEQDVPGHCELCDRELRLANAPESLCSNSAPNGGCCWR